MQPALYPTHMLYHAATGKGFASGSALCCLCGYGTAETVPIETVIRDTFTNHGMCRCPSSRVVCLACNHYFNHRWLPEGFKKSAEYRLLSLIATPGGWHSWQRNQMRADIETWLRDGNPGGVFVVALSKKKHLVPLATVNPPGGRHFTVQVEEERVRVGPDLWRSPDEAFQALLSLGCFKGEILSGNYSAHTVRKVGFASIRAHDRRVQPFRGGGMLTLVSYVTVLEKEAEETTDE